jgi:hypothetical protein
VFVIVILLLLVNDIMGILLLLSDIMLLLSDIMDMLLLPIDNIMNHTMHVNCKVVVRKPGIILIVGKRGEVGMKMGWVK